MTSDEQLVAALAPVLPTPARTEAADEEAQRKTVLQLMKAHAKFGRAERRCFGHQQLMLAPSYQINNLLQAARDLGPENAVRWLHTVHDTKSATIADYWEVYGVSIDGPCSFSNGVRLVTVASLLGERGRQVRAMYEFSVPEGVMRFGLPPLIAIHEKPNVLATPEMPDPELRFSRPIARAIRAIASVSDHAAPVLAVSWTGFTSLDLERAQFGSRISMSRFDGPLKSLGVDIKLDETACSQINHVLGLPEHVAALFDAVADRLILARSRVDAGNGAIDASICLEALFGDPSAQSEMTSRISLRAALFASNDIEERAAIRKHVKDLYTLRSKAVHAAKSVWSSKERDVAANGLKLVGSLLNKLAELHELPDWNVWELSGGKPDRPASA